MSRDAEAADFPSATILPLNETRMKSMTTPHAELRKALEQILCEAEERSDIEDGENGPLPNIWMRIAEEARAALAAPPSAEGWKWVPVTPSKEMLRVAFSYNLNPNWAKIIYEEMLSAVSASGKLRRESR